MLQKLRIVYSTLLRLLRTQKLPAPSSRNVNTGRIPIFNPGATSSNYVGYVRKTCFFFQEPPKWGADAVKNMIAALKLQWKGKYRPPPPPPPPPPNFIKSDVALRIPIRDSRDIPFAQMAYISFLYALRAPSEALHLRRAFRNDDMARFAPAQASDSVEIRGTKPGECLATLFLRRKNLPNECALSRPRFCLLS